MRFTETPTSKGKGIMLIFGRSKTQEIAGGIVASIALAISPLAYAQKVSLKTQSGAELGVTASYYKYEESSLAVREKGYKAGVDLALTATPGNDWFIRGDGRFTYGHNDYTGTGTQTGIPDWYTELLISQPKV